jgi:hypothetical protein
MLADDVGRQSLFLARAREEERERIPKDLGQLRHEADCILGRVRKKDSSGRFAERVLHGVDDAGAVERIVIWMERRPGALWAVGRAVNPQHRPSDEPRRDDYIFEGYELEDALEAANGALEDDVSVLERDGSSERVAPFTRSELLKPLERWFFGRR